MVHNLNCSCRQIHNAAQRPVELDQSQADAVEARIILDLRLGAAFTRMQTLALQNRFAQLKDASGPISYGPCQFPTLGFVVSRYEQVQAFTPEIFQYIYFSYAPPGPNGQTNGKDVQFNWKRGHLFDFDVAAAIYEGVIEQPLATVQSVKKKPTKKWCVIIFILLRLEFVLIWS